MPRVGESLRAHAFSIEAGGKGFNLLVAARRLGASVDGLMAVGTDLHAGLAEKALAEEGLPARILVQYPTQTGAGIGFVTTGGEDCLAVFPGANSFLSEQDVVSAAPRLSAADLVLAQFEIEDGPIVAAFRLARAAGVRTLLNPSPYRPVSEALLRTTSILVVNETELHHMAGDGEVGPIEAVAGGVASRLFACGVEMLLVTLGAAGAVLHRPDEPPLWQPAFPVPVVDTIGAGDAFTAGFATALAEGLAPADALVRGAACGALVVRRFGVLGALPTTADLQSYLSSTAAP
nr:ribokinase [Chthonobacter rhizosphaerae]